jgi:NADH-quinone oxidoreductase subunit I
MFKATAAIAKGLSITFKHLLPGHSTTVQYPAVKLQMSDRFRGLHRLVPSQDREKCVACYLCPTVCPAKCITVESAENDKGEKYPLVYKIDMLRCIFCGYCVEACPVEAIEMTDGYELANYKREDFEFTKERLLK